MSDRPASPVTSNGLHYPDGVAVATDRIGAQGDLMVSQLHGKLHEAAKRGVLFGAASQAATTTTIALATTYTGLCLSNPAGNNKDLALRQVGVSLSVAPAAQAAIGLGGGYSAAGIATHTTPLATYPMDLGGNIQPTGLADAACTLVAGAGKGLLRVIMPTLGGFTAAALPSHGGVVDFEGSIILRPGAFVFIYTLTVVIGFFGITWEEYER